MLGFKMQAGGELSGCQFSCSSESARYETQKIMRTRIRMRTMKKTRIRKRIK